MVIMQVWNFGFNMLFNIDGPIVIVNNDTAYPYYF
jgi:hypothetical protein